MEACNSLVGVPLDCGDNNLGSFKRALIADKLNITSITVTDTGSAPDTDGEVTAVTMELTTKFVEFPVIKDTSTFSQSWAGDLVADTHSYNQTVEMGLRRISLLKINASKFLAEGRRNLVVIVQDNNDDYWMLGEDQGMRVSASEVTSNATRSAGQLFGVTLTSENERHQMYKVDSTIIDALLVPAV